MIFVVVFAACLGQVREQINPATAKPRSHGDKTDIMAFDAETFVLDIIDALQDAAVYEDGKLKGWENRKNSSLPEEERIFRGYFLGVAGIGDFLLDAYLAGYTQVSSLLDDVIDHFVEDFTLAPTRGLFWSRYST